MGRPARGRRTAPQVVGVVPAAGYATRLGPLAGAKELLPIGGVPAIDHLIGRMRAVPGARVRVVTRPEKTDLVDHARVAGLELVLGHPPHVSASISLGARGLDPGDAVLLGFPDTIWEPADGFVRLLAAVEAGADLALGLFRTRELRRSDVMRLDASGRPLGVAVKPERPPSGWIWGCAVVRAHALVGVTDHPEPGVRFDRLCRAGRATALPLSEDFLDIGTRDALARATVRWG